MTEVKPLEVIAQVERVYNVQEIIADVQEIIADMKAMGGQVAEYALVVERLCDIIERQEKWLGVLSEDLRIAEEERDEQRERREEETEKTAELRAEIDTLKTRIKAFEWNEDAQDE